MYKPAFYERKGFFITVICVIVVGIVAFCVTVFPSYYHEKTATCTVTDKDRVSQQDGGSEMRVYTSDCGNFVVADSLVKTRFDSSDLYGSLKDGQKYEFTYYGWRIPILSAFPNLLDATPVK